MVVTYTGLCHTYEFHLSTPLLRCTIYVLYSYSFVYNDIAYMGLATNDIASYLVIYCLMGHQFHQRDFKIQLYS